VVVLLLVGCGLGTEPYDWNLPSNVDPPLVPADNPMSAAKVDLGRHLFYDKRLSLDNTVSCSSCHLQEHGFADPNPVSEGVHGERGSRNGMALANVAFLPTYTWGNPVLDTLEKQALVPMFLTAPLELGTTDVLAQRLVEFAGDSTYIDLFSAAYADEEVMTLDTMVDAIACFERSLVSFDSPYDQYVDGDETALTDSQIRGLALFGELGCSKCHEGRIQTAMRTSAQADTPARFANTGLYDLDGKGRYPNPNVGLFEFSYDKSDMGKHRVPSLRNIEVSAPYMHDGSIASLVEVLDHYAAGGRAKSEVTAEELSGFELVDRDRDDLLAFLRSLTDEVFLAQPAFSDPWNHPLE